MMKSVLILLACTLSAAAGEYEANGCRARWADGELTLANGRFVRVLRAVNGTMQTVSFRADSTEWIDPVKQTVKVAGPLPEIRAESAGWSFVGEQGVRVTAAFTAETNTWLILPSVAGTISVRPCRLTVEELSPALRSQDRDRWFTTTREGRIATRGADSLPLFGLHLRATEIDLHDQTDLTNELVSEREWLLMMREAPHLVSANVLTVEDTFSGAGLAFVRLAPLPEVRPVKLPDFVLSGSSYEPYNVPTITSVDNGWPVVELAYGGGKIGRIAALQTMQRALRAYRPGRDGVFLSNNWGAGFSDKHLNEAFLQREIAAGAELGVDVIQIDDGWQKGRSQNSSDVANKKKPAWGNFRHVDVDFWKPCPIRIPHGLEPLVSAAAAKGMRFGLWYGPDSAENARYWREDVDCLLSFYRDRHIQYFKIDSLKSLTAEAFANQRRLFDSLLEASNGDITFDLDVTIGERPGYFGLPHIGPIFVENRYTQHGGYWPHFTLRSLWSLAGVMDPVRMRIEVLDPDQYPERYAPDDPLRPARYRADTVFAVAMCASPLAWMELSRLSPQRRAEMKPLVARWKQERAALHGGRTWPIGALPDGHVWTGFVTATEAGDGYLLLFRELAAQNAYTFDVAPYLKGVASVEVIGGRGKASLANGKVTVSGVDKLDFVWVKLSKKRPASAASAAGSMAGAEEQEFMRNRVEYYSTLPGTPESDAVRFYSSTSRNEYVAFNYDESKAGVLGRDYTLPDPLKFADGRPVTRENWPARRREILALFEREVYGKMPPPPDEMVVELVSEKLTDDRFAWERRYRQYFHSDKTGPVIDWLAIVPKQTKKPCPVIVQLNYVDNDTVASGRSNHYPMPLGDIVAHGFAFLSAKYTQITSDGADRGGGCFDGVCALWGPRDFAKMDNPGTLMIWAWGLSRGLDLAERIPECDAKHNMVIGSSRLGKAALLAAAYDARFQVCVPNQTGAVGVQLMKRDYGETLAGQRLSFAYWYCRNVWKWMGREREMPFDQHLLLACVAPRNLLLECYHKKWFDPKGERLAAEAAAPVWELLTGKGLGPLPEPYSEAAVQPPFGYVRRTECHGVSPYDWKWALDFAEKSFRDGSGRQL